MNDDEDRHPGEDLELGHVSSEGTVLNDSTARQKLRMRNPDSRNSSARSVEEQNHKSTKHAVIQAPSEKDSSNSGDKKKEKPRWKEEVEHLYLLCKPNTAWIHANLDITHLKPVIRSALSAWISILLLVIFKSEKVMGQVRDRL